MKTFLKIGLVCLVLMLLWSSSGITADPDSETKRFTVSPEGVILDSETGLEWVVGPDTNTDYDTALQWVADCATAGDGWRMPTRKELSGIYQQAAGDRNLDPAFKITGFYAWAQPRDTTSAWAFNFGAGEENWFTRRTKNYCRVLAVRSNPETTPNMETAGAGKQPSAEGPLADQGETSEAGSLQRFIVLTEGVITDSQTGLEWVMGPDKDVDYGQACKWVDGCSTAGGGWRMPTRKELATLYLKGTGDINMDPAFKMNGRYVWAEPRNPSSACYYSFDAGFGFWCAHTVSDEKRVMGVRLPAK